MVHRCIKYSCAMKYMWAPLITEIKWCKCNRLSGSVTCNCWQLTLACVSAVSTSIFPCEAVRATSFFWSWPSSWWHCSRAESSWSESWWKRGRGGGEGIICKYSELSKYRRTFSLFQKYPCMDVWVRSNYTVSWCQHTWELLALAASSFCSFSLAFSCMDKYAPSSFSWRDLWRTSKTTEIETANDALTYVILFVPAVPSIET